MDCLLKYDVPDWFFEHCEIPADKPFPTYYAQQNALPKAKKEFPQLGEAPAQVLQTTIRRLHDAWKYFQDRGFGFPRFKKFGQMKSILFPNEFINVVHVDMKQIETMQPQK